MFNSGQHDDEFYKELWATVSRGVTWRGRIENKKKDGTLFTEDSSISPIYDEEGTIINYVAVKRDVTEQLHLEEQYHQAQKVESIGRLAGGVAHDLNNLLTPILGYCEMLLDDFGADDSRREYVDVILQSGMSARDLVRQLLAFSRKQTLEYKPVNLNAIIENFENLLQRTIREDIKLKIITSPGIGFIMADIGQIEQVIMNVVVNASDAMPDGGHLMIETKPVVLDHEYAARHHGVEVGNYYMLAISDTGCGIEKEILDRIFEPFFSTKGEQGTGLGLATVYGIVKQHGGNIWVYSEPGSGTSFKIYLPTSDELPVQTPARKTRPTGSKSTETILLAEDNQEVRNLAGTILTREGYRVLMAENGSEAMDLLKSHDGDLHILLTDVVMPEIDGKELFSQASKKYPRLKVLYMSGYTDDVIVHRGVLEKDTSFIQKPFTVQSLITKVREILDSN